MKKVSSGSIQVFLLVILFFCYIIFVCIPGIKHIYEVKQKAVILSLIPKTDVRYTHLTRYQLLFRVKFLKTGKVCDATYSMKYTTTIVNNKDTVIIDTDNNEILCKKE
ncbi:MAG: hypothetical protein WCO35_02990 [Candidatus Nomurabacteria bacterium]